MNITITITYQEYKEAVKSADSFEQFLDICKCKYELELYRAMFEAIKGGGVNDQTKTMPHSAVVKRRL